MNNINNENVILGCLFLYTLNSMFCLSQYNIIILLIICYILLYVLTNKDLLGNILFKPIISSNKKNYSISNVIIEKPIPTSYNEIQPPTKYMEEHSYKSNENIIPDPLNTSISKGNTPDSINSNGDYLLAEKMKHLSMTYKINTDAVSRINKYTNYGFCAEELNDHANTAWWDDDTLENIF